MANDIVFPRLVMNEVVKMGKGMYTVSFFPTTREYEFTPVGGTVFWSDILFISEKRVANGINMGAIISISRPDYFF